MEVGQPNSSTFAKFASDKDAIWQAMIKKYDLKKTDLQTVAQWPYGDYVFSPQWDVVSDMSKAQRDGFTETISTPKMFTGGFDYFRQHKMIP
jgi:hypothetical protein